jgi:quinoprotein dehydrogenase-associated probable ABC transporter substrate-binding protein
MSSHCLDPRRPSRRIVARARRLALASLAAGALLCAAAPALAGGIGMSWLSYASGAGAVGDSDDPASHVLRVCADPDNLPYSKRDGSGFENRIASLVAQALHARLEYVWTPPTRGFVRKTLGANLCDVLIGVPSGFASLLTTRPYYRSSYVFVDRAGDGVAPLRRFDDERIAQLRIGVPLVGSELTAATPAYALARAGAIDNVVGYPLYGNGPPAERMLDALAQGTIDAALLWGPQAGYFAERSAVPLQVERAEPPPGLESAFEFSIAMGVARGHELLRAALDKVLDAHRDEVDAILRHYAVPRSDQQAEVVGKR